MMKRLMNILVYVGLTSLMVMGCEKKETPAPVATAAETPPPAPAPPAAAPPEPTVDVASLPVEEQYEAAAETEITADNVVAKLDELEKELAAP